MPKPDNNEPAAPIYEPVLAFCPRIFAALPLNRNPSASDKANDSARKKQSGPVTVTGEVDRIYTGVAGELTIDDPSLGRRIRIASRGCSTTVVWNPWIDIAASMADLGDDDYKRMICVETANAGPETVEIAAGGEYRLEAEYTLER